MRLGLAAAALLVLASALPAAAQSGQGLLGVYAENRREGLPNFVTEDLVLTGFALVQRHAQQRLEEQTLVPLHTRFVARLAERVATADRDPVSEANADFLAVVAALDRGSCEGLADQAGEECGLAMAAAGIAPSPLWGYRIDYSQLQPRGRYAQEESLRPYFRSVRYAGTVLFAVKPSAATGVDAERAERHAAQALALVRLISADTELADLRAEQERWLGWRFGPADDLTDADLRAVMEEAESPDAEALFAYAQAHDRHPRIIGGVLDAAKLEEGVTAAQAMTGWRLLPSRYAAEVAAFQRLVYDGTGTYLGPAEGKKGPPFGLALVDNRPVKGYPSAIELMALLGSAPAREILERRGEHRFEGYAAAFEEAAAIVSGGEGRNGDYLRFMSTALGAPVPQGAERLNALQAFWTWQRYLDLLYQKQSYTLAGKGMAMESPRAGARLEPSTALYRALAALVAAERRQDPEAPYWTQFAKLLDRLIVISARIDAGQSPSADDERLLNEIDRTLLELVGAEDRPIVVDVHTNPTEGLVVEEALGWAREVRLGPARGARFDHREFKQPLTERLTDAAWIERLYEEAAQGGDDVSVP